MAKTILMVDDSPSIRELVGYTLRHAGYDVIEAVDGLEGVERAQACRLDLVITDIGANPARVHPICQHADPSPHHRVDGGDETARQGPRGHRLAGEALRSQGAGTGGPPGRGTRGSGTRSRPSLGMRFRQGSS